MSKSEENVIQASKKLAEIRERPLLILNLMEIRHGCCLDLHKILLGKNYKELDVILQTPGGDIDAAYNIVKLLRHSSKKVNVIVPLYAKSAGTLICLGGDDIIMTILSELGPLDTQIREDQEGGPPTYTSALNGFKALEQIQLHTLETLDIATKLILQRSGMKISEAITLAIEFSGNTSGTLYRQLEPKKIGEYARALEIGERYGIIILTRYMKWNFEKADNVIKQLVKSYPAHGFVIDVDELSSLGLPAMIASEQEEVVLDELRLSLLKTKDNIIELIEQSKKNAKGKGSSKIKKTIIKGDKSAKDKRS